MGGDEDIQAGYQALLGQVGRRDQVRQAETVGQAAIRLKVGQLVDSLEHFVSVADRKLGEAVLEVTGEQPLGPASKMIVVEG